MASRGGKFRLTDNHPLKQKVNRLFDFLEENGLEISSEYYGLVFTDTTTGASADLVDIEDNENMPSFPGTAYKLIALED